MIPLTRITGRLGNQMFEFAALYSHAQELGVDFYFQDERFFKKYEADIKELFGTDIGYLTQTSIHVRRGDYVDNPFYVDLTKTDYYDRAIALFPHEKFLVFSDDPEWCKTKFTDTKRFQVMEGGSELEDLNIMASCQNNIIANSSFSWWAAWLNPNYNKRVLAPKQWYADGLERTKCPPSWERI